MLWVNGVWRGVSLLSAVPVDGTPPLGAALPLVPTAMVCSLCLGFPHGNRATDRRHTSVFLHLVLEFISVKGAGFLLSLHAVAWPTPGKPRCSARRVVRGSVLFAWKHYAFTEQFSSQHPPVLKSPKALPGISWRGCHCNKCL